MRLIGDLLGASVVYVHVADDGGILVVDGETGWSARVAVSELVLRLRTLQAAGGSILLSREKGSPIATEVLDLVAGLGLPTVHSPAIHPDAIRAGGATALMAAAYLGEADLVDDLLQRGADMEVEDSEGTTALMYAVNAGQERIAELLIGNGADVNHADREGSTPLMFAAQRGNISVLKRLLAARACVRSRRPDGLTAYALATMNGHERAAGILLSAELRD